MQGPPILLVSADAFRQFYNRTHLNVFRFIYGIYGGPLEEVEDLTEETFLRAWKARQRFSGTEQAALAWILTIARNLVIDAHRKRHGRITTALPDVGDNQLSLADNQPSPEEQISQQEQQGILLASLQKLPLEDREMIVKRYILGWQVKKIAEDLGMLENTVTVRIRRALSRMRKDWPDDGR